MTDLNIINWHLIEAANAILEADDPHEFDFEAYFIEHGCNAEIAELLSDYLPCACGRGFAREIGMVLSDTYQRRVIDGSLSENTRYDADPIWVVVESFAETIRKDKVRRKQFSLIAKHSAEVDAVNHALNAGETLADLAGAKFSGIFNSPY
jgi:hypothetical protein